MQPKRAEIRIVDNLTLSDDWYCLKNTLLIFNEETVTGSAKVVKFTIAATEPRFCSITVTGKQ